MHLKFVGKNGSMGLKCGEIYRVKVYSRNGYIWVEWDKNKCPYSSPKSFADNWEHIWNRI